MDLGITITADMKVSEQCRIAVSKGNQILGLIRRKGKKLRDLSYEERLKEFCLTTLETRRSRGDQTEVFKILNGYENIDRNICLTQER